MDTRVLSEIISLSAAQDAQQRTVVLQLGILLSVGDEIARAFAGFSRV